MPKPVGKAQRYIPGLDGLRAVAVLAVIAYHLQLGWAQGGLLGVGVFFTLSGYLITDLLLGQHERFGAIPLKDFWLRRARRLLPALFLMLAVVVIWAALLHRSQLPSLRQYVLAAVLYVSNWWSIARQASYFARFGPPPPLDHLWSLAVEEQFYLLWPWLLWLGVRYVRARYHMAGLTLALAALSAVCAALLYHPGYDPTRVYEGTDTRACGLLIGAALAMVWPSRHLRPNLIRWRRRLLDGIGVAGLVVIALLIWQTNQYSPSLYRGGLVLLSVATAAVVAALAHPASLLGRAMGVGPLRWLGVRSYGIYLWHYPIIVFTTPALARASPPLEIIQVGAIIAVAALSWRLVEEPIRRGALATLWAHARLGGWWVVPRESRAALLGALGVLGLAGCSLAGMPITIHPIHGQASQLSRATAVTVTPSAVQRTPILPTLVPVSTVAPAVAAPPVRQAGPVAQPAGPRRWRHRWRRPVWMPPRTFCHSVAYIGDSTSEGMILPDYLPNPAQRLDAKLARVGATDQHIDISGARSVVETLPGQTNGYDVAQQLAASGFRGCWIIALGTDDTADVAIGSTVDLMTRIRWMMSIIGRRPVLWATVKTLLDSGPYSEADMQRWNRTLLQSCARYPNMRVFDWASLMKDGWFISDGVHYTSWGYAQRARLTAAALPRAFSAPGRHWHRGCLVR